jgi:hypothetical protein
MLTGDEAMLDPSCICCGHVRVRGSNLAGAFLMSRRIVEPVKIGCVGLSNAGPACWSFHRIVRGWLQLLIAEQLFVWRKAPLILVLHTSRFD